MKISEIPQNANPLDMDLSGLDTSMPLLAGGVAYELLIKKCELQDSKSHPGDKLLYIELTNNTPAQSASGDTLVAQAATVFDRINLKAYGKATPAMVAQQVARFQQALGLSGPLGPQIPSIAGRIIKAKIDVAPEGVNKANGKSFAAKNEVAFYYKAGQ